MLLAGLSWWVLRHPAGHAPTGRLVIGWAAVIGGVLGIAHALAGTPQPVDGASAMREGGGFVGFLVAAPLVSGLTVWLAVPVMALAVAFGVLVLTATPVHQVPERLAALRARLLGRTDDEVVDLVAADLRVQASRLLAQLADVSPVYPRPEVFNRGGQQDPLLDTAVRSGLEAVGWVRDERGLGGGRQMSGLAWALPLDRLWEEHVAAHVRERARVEGGMVRLGRRGQTLVPLRWSTPVHRSVGALVPDIVVQRSQSVWVRSPSAAVTRASMARDWSGMRAASQCLSVMPSQPPVERKVCGPSSRSVSKPISPSFSVPSSTAIGPTCRLKASWSVPRPVRFT